jgi:anti-sigma regulatory factor (Ser/Thr protein kinase)
LGLTSGSAEKSVESIDLEAVAFSVALARDFVRSVLADRPSDEAFFVELLTSELVSNVVRHAETQFTVVVALESCVRIEVHDGVAATDAFRELVNNPPEFTAASPGGRGLPLVREVAARFGLQEEPGKWNGKIVWFEIDRTDLPS